MGRYYNGDVEGKFWFGVQSSSDGEFFGAVPTAVEYSVGDIKQVELGIEACKFALGDHLNKLTQFFNSHNGYNDGMIIEYYKTNFNEPMSEKIIRELLEWYARLELGTQIYNHMKENEYGCTFTAEL